MSRLSRNSTFSGHFKKTDNPPPGIRITAWKRGDGQKSVYRLEIRVNGFRIDFKLPCGIREFNSQREALRAHIEKCLDSITSKEALIEVVSKFFGKPILTKKSTPSPQEKLNSIPSPIGTLSWLLKLYLSNTKHKHQQSTWTLHLKKAQPILKLLGSVSLNELSTAHLLQYQAQRKAQGVGNRTVNIEIGLIRKVLNWAIDMGIIEGHKVKKFPMLPENKRLHAYLTEEEVYRLFEVLKAQNPLLAYRLLFNVLTGLRPKEIAFLEWTDIDFANRLLFVRSKPENQIKDREERAIPLCETALHILEEVRRLNPKGKYVFSRNGKPVISVRKQLERASLKAGLPKKVFPYMLRHTFAVFSLKAGVNIYDLKELMGHSDLETTSRYLHTCRAFLFDAVRKLDNLLDLTTKEKPVLSITTECLNGGS